MGIVPELVRSLEQQEFGEIRRLRCSECGARSFASREQLERHERICAVPGTAVSAKRDVKAP